MQKVIVVGAGIAGLVSSLHLAQAGFEVEVLESRDRVGGRIWTVHDAAVDAPVELGAEFVHGRVEQLFRYAKPGVIDFEEGDGSYWCVENDKLRHCDFFDQVNDILERAKKHKGPDLSFDDFLATLAEIDQRKKHRATNYVRGFHAANPADIGVQAINLDTRAEEATDSDRMFRIRNGYGALVELLHRSAVQAGVQFHLGCRVHQVTWSGSEVRIGIASPGEQLEFASDVAVITMPISILQLPPESEGGIEFNPPLDDKREPLGLLRMGHVQRIVLVFREQFWSDPAVVDRSDLADLKFLFSEDRWFPTLWTLEPRRVPMLTLWSPAHASEGLAGKSKDEVTGFAVRSLAHVFKISPQTINELLVSSHYHDWLADPNSLGAYSYAGVGGVQAFAELARPLGRKLYFAGEATEATGHHATVHGAIASGDRVAREIIATHSRRST